MAMYEDFDLDITTTDKHEVDPARYNNKASNLECITYCYTCGACSVTCYGRSNTPCDR